MYLIYIWYFHHIAINNKRKANLMSSSKFLFVNFNAFYSFAGHFIFSADDFDKVWHFFFSTSNTFFVVVILKFIISYTYLLTVNFLSSITLFKKCSSSKYVNWFCIGKHILLMKLSSFTVSANFNKTIRESVTKKEEWKTWKIGKLDKIKWV